MDALTFDALLRELSPQLTGAAIQQVHQPDRDTLLLRLWTGRRTLGLRLCAVPGRAYLRLADERLPNPATPPRFCQLLRARLSRLLRIEFLPGERVVTLVFRGRDGKDCRLIAELFGGRPNLVLTDATGTIIDVLRRESGDGGRDLLSGHSYQAPQPMGRFQLAAEAASIPVELCTGAAFAAWLMAEIAPMSFLLAADLAAGVDAGEVPRDLLASFHQQWQAGTFRPVIGYWRGRAVISPYALRYLELEDSEYFPTVNDALAGWLDKPETKIASRDERDALQTVVRRARRRLEIRLQKLDGEAVALADGAEFGRWGELLLANLRRLRRGLSDITVDDYYQDPPAPLTIPLDPRWSPQENIERYFARARKARRGIEHLARRRAESGTEMDWLESVALALEEAAGPAELLAVRHELETAGLLPPPDGAARRHRAPQPQDQLRRERTPGGYALLWGRNNRSNDYLTQEVLAADDLWLHAQGLPGCHLVLKRGGAPGEIPEADILHAAAIAAGYSRGRDAARVEVIVAAGRQVRKPKGARPGLVTVGAYRTVWVKPVRP